MFARNRIACMHAQFFCLSPYHKHQNEHTHTQKYKAAYWGRVPPPKNLCPYVPHPSQKLGRICWEVDMVLGWSKPIIQPTQLLAGMWQHTIKIPPNACWPKITFYCVGCFLNVKHMVCNFLLTIFSLCFNILVQKILNYFILNTYRAIGVLIKLKLKEDTRSVWPVNWKY